MNRNISEGKWKQLRGEIRSTWAELTDDEIDATRGKFDVLAGVLQEKYGLAHEEIIRKLSALKRAFNEEK